MINNEFILNNIFINIGEEEEIKKISNIDTLLNLLSNKR